jgi:hypothetical protein
MTSWLRFGIIGFTAGFAGLMLSLTSTGTAIAQGAVKPLQALIVNTPAQPVPVLVTNSPASVGIPYQESISKQVDPGQPGATNVVFSTVPAGKRLIIEHVSAYVRNVGFGSLTGSHFILEDDSLVLSRPSASELMTNTQTKVIVEAGDSPTLRTLVGGSVGPSGPPILFDIFAFISGTLVPAE